MMVIISKGILIIYITTPPYGHPFLKRRGVGALRTSGAEKREKYQIENSTFGTLCFVPHTSFYIFIILALEKLSKFQRSMKSFSNRLHFVQSMTAQFHSDRERPIVQLAISQIRPEVGFQ